MIGKIFAAALALLLLPVPVRAAGPPSGKWIPLVKGSTLNGWRAEGNATWSASNGVLIGRQGPAGAAGDLYSEAHYKDFELEVEWKMTWPGNSGVWFRVNGPRSGYQADFIDQSSHPGVLSGSLYCMGKAFIAENRDAATVHKDGWNKLRIHAEGDRYRIWLNGRQVVDKRDNAFPGAGSVGIQIHAGKAFDGMEVQLRNFRIRPLGEQK
ncbi:MAG: DUF1080 domain-containing protein [Acidobacteria bacterium]|nr:DUF1080 domain-containing protein [Acidobacteriota bacterium]